MGGKKKEGLSRKQRKFAAHIATIARLNVLLACVIAVGVCLLFLWARSEYISSEYQQLQSSKLNSISVI